MLRLGAQQWELFRRGECKECQPLTRLRDRFAARQWLQQFRGNSMCLSALRHLLSRESSVSLRLDRATDDDILEQAAQLLATGLWHVHAPETGHPANTQGPGAEPPEPSETDSPAKRPTPAPSPSTKLTWIEIRLVDDDGNPVPGVAYEITFPDGSIRSGSLSARGTARYDQIEPGQCVVKFPELDAQEWDKR